MPNSQLHTAMSEPRFGRYLTACKYKHGRAIELYKANLLLSQRMYAVNGVFEVILRNSVDRHFIPLKGQFWLEDAVQPEGYLDNEACQDSFHSVHDAIFKLGLSYTHDRLIAKLTFGFWTYQFAEKEYAAAGSSLLGIFSNKPTGTRQKIVFKNLFKINDLRNRIAHYEPICFDPQKGNISTAQVKRRYDLVKEMLYWLGCDPTTILDGIDWVEEAIQRIDDI
ncbi:MAG: hypothetical protein WCF67_22730 [Chitinophagaceae bacterium]